MKRNEKDSLTTVCIMLIPPIYGKISCLEREGGISARQAATAKICQKVPSLEKIFYGTFLSDVFFPDVREHRKIEVQI